MGIIAYQLLTGRLPFSGDLGDEVTELFMEKQLFENKACLFAGALTLPNTGPSLECSLIPGGQSAAEQEHECITGFPLLQCWDRLLLELNSLGAVCAPSACKMAVEMQL